MNEIQVNSVLQTFDLNTRQDVCGLFVGTKNAVDEKLHQHFTEMEVR